MPGEPLSSWRQECDAIEQEMDRLVRSPVPASDEERQVRRGRFAALVQRREDAARKLIQADRARFRHSWRRDSPTPGEFFISASHAASTNDASSTPFVKIPGGRTAAETVGASPDSSAMGVSSAADTGEGRSGARATESIPANSSIDPAKGPDPTAPVDPDAPADPH